MSVLTVENLNFGYQNENLYNSLSFALQSGEHATLVGPNGSGKTTLMRLICHDLSLDSGRIEWSKGISYAYLDQQLEVKGDIRIDEYLYGVYKDLFEREKKLNTLYQEASLSSGDNQATLLERAESIRESLEIDNFYNIEVEVNNVVNGLGLREIDLSLPLSMISGGEKAKVYLAKLLLEKPDVLLMDEPTNFLDKYHIEWLENYLNAFKGTFLIISHDDAFLKSISKVVYALENKNIVKYKGDYSYYLSERNSRHERADKEYERQKEFIKKTKMFIEKNLTRASTTKRAQSRRKMLEKLSVIEKPKEEYKIHIRFPYSKDLGQQALVLDELVVGYDSPLLPPVSHILKKNERIELIGRNGVGKSTLVKTILSSIPPISGSFRINPSATINYFSQEEVFDESLTPMGYIREKYPDMKNEDVLKTLAPLGIKRDLAIKKMSELSGGERQRVRLSRMTLLKSNFLILDEPTNHLDKVSKEALHESIEDFPGSVIIVSHEKGFADDLVDYVISFKKGE